MQPRPANLAAILANDPIFQGLSAAIAAMPRPTPQPLGTTAPTYITGTPARVSQRNRAALAGMVERAKADGRPAIIKAAIARVEASRAAIERGCALARHERGLNLFDYVEALAGLREAL